MLSYFNVFFSFFTKLLHVTETASQTLLNSERNVLVHKIKFRDSRLQARFDPEAQGVLGIQICFLRYSRLCTLLHPRTRCPPYLTYSGRTAQTLHFAPTPDKMSSLPHISRSYCPSVTVKCVHIRNSSESTDAYSD